MADSYHWVKLYLRSFMKSFWGEFVINRGLVSYLLFGLRTQSL